MNIEFTRSDITYKREDRSYTDINVIEDHSKEFYHIVTFPKSYDKKTLIGTLSCEFETFLASKMLQKPLHVLIVGLGNESLTADSVGPRIIKRLTVNSHLKTLGLPLKGNILSALEPGVLGQTGIETDRIVASVTEEISPDLVILIDAIVTDFKEELTRTIVLSDEGLIPGSGLKGLNCEISSRLLGCPVLTIGIPTGLEVRFAKQKKGDSTYLMSPSNIDLFVEDISRTIASALNEYFLKDVKY